MLSFSHPLISCNKITIGYTDLLYANNLSLAETLSSLEIRQYALFPSNQRQLSYFLGRISIKKAISNHISKILTFSSISVENNLAGKPFIKDYPVNLSISHSANLALSVVSASNINVGIDFEKITPSTYVTEQWLAANELTLIRNRFINTLLGKVILWVAKEAMSKLIGTGFNIDWYKLMIEKIYFEHWGYLITFTYFKNIYVYIWQVEEFIIGLALENDQLINPSKFRNKLFTLFKVD